LGKLELSGINKPYLYVGGYRTMFAWHTEDLNLGSINYLHYGCPKFWYCISAQDYKKFDAYVKNKYPEAFLNCPEYLRHKTILVNPYLLKEYNPNIKIHK